MIMSKKAEKSPYKNHTLREVMEAEAGHYYIQLGDSMFETESGLMAFSKERAEKFYAQILEGLQDMKKNGTKQDQAEAVMVLLNFRIVPLRFH